MSSGSKAFAALVLVGAIASGYLWGRSDERAGRVEPLTETASAEAELDVYYPGSEALGPDEMRVVACGTGMPNARPKQAAACWLVELGNGDKFLFDIGLGSARAALGAEDSLRPPGQGLHRPPARRPHRRPRCAVDRRTSMSNRLRPLRVWGPIGAKPELGTKYMRGPHEGDVRLGLGLASGQRRHQGRATEVHEFDYKAVNEVIYEEKGVTISLDPGDPRGRWVGQLHPEVERPQVRILVRHLPQQVVDGAHQGRRHRDPRVLRAAVDHGTKQRFRGARRAQRGDPGPHLAGHVRQGHVEITPRMAVGYHTFCRLRHAARRS